MASASLPLHEPDDQSTPLPDYLPARMVNEYVYCPRLFLHVFDDIFRHSTDTLEGSAQHKRVDRESKGLPAAEALGDEKIHSRSVMLSSEQHRVIAKMDLIEAANGTVTPVDYKHGKPREKDGALELWPTDRVQLCIQGLVCATTATSAMKLSCTTRAPGSVFASSSPKG